MSYARKWYLDPIQSSDLIILTREPRGESTPAMLFDLSTKANVGDAFDAVWRALHKLSMSGKAVDDIDRADAVLAALGIVHETVDAVPELRRAG